MSSTPRRAAIAIALALALGGCSVVGASPPPAPGTLSVVTTITVFGDLIKQVGADHVTVTSLVPAGTDVHTYEPKPADLQAVTTAGLIVMNGLNLDEWLKDTITDASAGGTPLVELGEGLEGVDLLPGEEPGEENPHLWMAVPYAIKYVDRIEAALAAADPANAEAFRRNADAYRGRLDALDASIRQRLDTIPAENRKLVMYHDAFPYFAREYGLEIVGVAVEAPGQNPSAGEIAELVDAIKAAGVKAIFSEDQFPTAVVEQIAAETGATVVADLYDDSLGDPPVTTYEAMIEWDVDQLVDALR
jgi:ABC-type Zn uptake system ZnuABC Zn-binding protein ZnuA